MLRKRSIWVFITLIAIAAIIAGCDFLGERKNPASSEKEMPMVGGVSPSTGEISDAAGTTEIGENVKPPDLARVMTSWSSMTQAERNMAILYRADRDNGRYVGLNCKEWVRRVLLDASGGLVYLPQTLPNESGWYFAYSRYLVGMCGGIRYVNQGWIVQMNWRRTDGVIIPHTLIIAGRSPSGIYVIESNWCMNNCMTVAYRWISFTDFEARAVRYSCYYVTGG